MTKEQKTVFDMLNSCWTLIQPYVKDQEKEYKAVMTQYYKIVTNDRGEKWTDEWMDSITKDLMDYPDTLKDKQDICGFAAGLTVAVGEYLYKTKHTNYDFYRCVGKAFVEEWERLNEETDKAQATG